MVQGQRGRATPDAPATPSSLSSRGSPASQAPMNSIAERYVKLVLAVGEHDAAYVDAYYGPPEWKQQVSGRKRPLADLEREADDLLAALGPSRKGADAETLRHTYLSHQLSAVKARVRMLRGAKMTFDEESRALYDAVAPTDPESYFQGTLDELDRMLPRGEGTIAERLERFRAQFVIPKDRLGR